LTTNLSVSTLFDLSGRRALVTGASGGLGLHAAEVLAREGASVALAARRTTEIRAAAADLVAEGYRACGVYLDVMKPETIPAAFDSVETELGGPVDLLVNNAGILYVERFSSQSVGEMQRVIDTNLKGAFLVSQEAARRMPSHRNSCIVNIASTAGLRAAGLMSSYGASKAGLIHLAQILAVELAAQGIRVNTICPGNFETDMHAAFAGRGIADGLLKRIPQRRFGVPRDLDGPLLLLASDAGRYMTGAVLTVDGGQCVSWM
jgi:NAD(P)-dependent dehydrogenase (short-subunit alcohol dehydrogenase family)